MRRLPPRSTRTDTLFPYTPVFRSRLAIRLIALRAPMADDLREVVAALKIATVVERIGDYAKNIAKRVPAIEDHGRIEPLSLLPAMARMAGEMVQDRKSTRLNSSH